MIENEEIENIYNNIKLLIEDSRNRIYKTVNIEMITLYWNIGKMIVQKQEGKEKAKYKDYLIKELSIKLTNQFGKGFSKRNLERMRKFYFCYPIATTLLSQLTWSHYLELIKIEEKNKTIGILLSTNKNETIVNYTLPENNETIFSSEFKLTLPTEQEFINIVEDEINNLKLLN